MPLKLRLPYATALILVAIQGAAFAQWLEYPTPRCAADTGRQAQHVGARAAHC